MEFKEVHKGIDSLYLSFKGKVKDEVLEELEAKKLLAQSEDEAEKSKAVMAINGHYFEIRDKGRGKFKYVLVDNWFHVQVSASKTKSVPDIYIQVSSELLNCIGLERSMVSLRNLLTVLMDNLESELVSRADLFVDFVTDKDFDLIEKASWVARAKKVQKYWEGNQFTGWTVGQGGDTSARLYNKSIEIEKKNILLEAPIKNLGVYAVEVGLHPEVKATMKLWVVKG